MYTPAHTDECRGGTFAFAQGLTFQVEASNIIKTFLIISVYNYSENKFN